MQNKTLQTTRTSRASELIVVRQAKGACILSGESPDHIKSNQTVCIESCDEVS